MNNRKEDWEEVLSRLTQENTPKRKTDGVAGMIAGILAFSLLNGITAVVFMVINSVLESAWPNLEAISPGIGYRDAFTVTGLLWLVFFIRMAVIMSLGRSNDRS